MSKGLDAYKRINELGLHLSMPLYKGFCYQEDLSIIEQELKALEIIITNKVNIANFVNAIYKTDGYKEYVESFDYGDHYFELGPIKLTEEEFNIVKSSIFNEL